MSEPHLQYKKNPGRCLWHPGFLLPAAEAPLIQLISLLLLYSGFLAAEAIAGWQVTIGIAVLMQGALAALITYWRRLPRWWLPLQFFFPLAVLVTHALDVSPIYFLVGFLIIVFVYWMPFKTRVPLYLSGKAVWDKVAEFIPENEPVRFIDIGSGIGGLVLYLSDRFPKANCSGVELAPLPWLISWLRVRFTKSRASCILGNYNNVDFSQFDILFAFLSPTVMTSLWKKASNEMRGGALLLSYEFGIPDKKPDIVILPESGRRPLYGWRISNISHK